MKTYSDHVTGNRVVLVGPPGTGKSTTALRDFIIPALKEHPPERILACSFSNAAADELRQRLSIQLNTSENALRRTCSTLHSEALACVRVALGDSLKLYDPLTDTARSFKRETLPDVESKATATAEAAVGAWDMARSLLVHKDEKQLDGWCAEFARRHKATKRETRAKIDYFEARKAELGALDFTDMLMRALRLPPRVSGFALLLVDEAQDCTPLQWALIDHWSDSADRVVVIGDGDQCIHEWAGASYIQFVNRLRSDEWDSYVLAQSWRVPLLPHGLARSIIQTIDDREDAEYAPAARDGSIDDCGQGDVIEMARQVAAEYRNAPEVIQNGDVVPAKTREMFILMRTKRDVLRMRKALNEAGVPYADEKPGAPKSHAVVAARTARTLIELARGGSAPVALAKDALERVPAKGWFDGTKTKLLAAMPEQGDVTLVDMPWFKAGASVTALVASTKLAGDPNYWVKVADAYGAWVLTEPPPIRVMTMHASKGREADVVAVCAEKSPAALFNGVDDAELRVLYVATTRTKDKLMLFARGGYEVYDELYAEAETPPPF